MTSPYGEQPAYRPPYQPPSQPPRRKPRYWLRVLLAVAGAVVVLIIIGAALGSGGGSGTGAAATPPASPAAGTGNASPAATHKPARPKITYIVTGSPADVTYGAAGNSLSGHVPMHVTRPLRNKAFYSIQAQLNGAGHVRCTIEVNGKVIAHSKATGSYNIATCEISRDPFSGKWSDTTSG